MNKLIVFGVLGLFLVGGMLFLSNINEERIENNNQIDTGMTPEQTWRIINGEDIREVLNLEEISR